MLTDNNITILRNQSKKKYKRLSEFRIQKLDNGNTMHRATYRNKAVQAEIQSYFSKDDRLIFMIIREPERFIMLKLQDVDERLPETK